MRFFQLNYLYFLSVIAFTISVQVTAQYLLNSSCSPGNYEDNSPFERNLYETLALLSSNIKPNKTFYNNSIGLSSNRVYGMLLCTGGLRASTMARVANIVLIFQLEMPLNIVQMGKNILQWYTNCMLRYSNRSIFSVMEVEPTIYLELIKELMNDLIARASSNGTGVSSNIKFAAGEVNYTSLKVQGLVQCTPYLSGSDCNTCLSSALDGRRFLQLFREILKPSCYVRTLLCAGIKKPVFIVVPIVALVAVALILGIIIYFCKRKWRLKEKFYGKYPTFYLLQFSLAKMYSLHEKQNILSKYCTILGAKV
ncbi:hypothetical protein MKX01_012050 [Papaver californicum]|nr:hypothetical protein MKX01_012050 [Papaver californicum]